MPDLEQQACSLPEVPADSDGCRGERSPRLPAGPHLPISDMGRGEYGLLAAGHSRSPSTTRSSPPEAEGADTISSPPGLGGERRGERTLVSHTPDLEQLPADSDGCRGERSPRLPAGLRFPTGDTGGGEYGLLVAGHSPSSTRSSPPEAEGADTISSPPGLGGERRGGEGRTLVSHTPDLELQACSLPEVPADTDGCRGERSPHLPAGPHLPTSDTGRGESTKEDSSNATPPDASDREHTGDAGSGDNTSSISLNVANILWSFSTRPSCCCEIGDRARGDSTGNESRCVLIGE